MALKGIVTIGECMLELSGQGEQSWRMGFAGDTLNTLWALRALTGSRASCKLHLGLRRRPVLQRPDRVPWRQRHRNRRKPDHRGRAAGHLCHHIEGRGAFLHLLAQRLGSKTACLRPKSSDEKPSKSVTCLFFRNHFGNSRRAIAQHADRCGKGSTRGGQPDCLRSQLPPSPVEVARGGAGGYPRGGGA